MDNKLLYEYKNDSIWAETIKLYSGLFESQNQRESFIRDLSQTNILLSAECKMTSIKDEEELENEIIKTAFFNFKNNSDYLSLFTLISMGEYLIARDVLAIKYDIIISKNETIRLMINRVEPIRFIEKIFNEIPSVLSTFLLKAWENNLVSQNGSYYETLIELSDPIQSVNYFLQMKKEGIKPTEKILNLLISKDGINNGEKYYKEFETNQITPTISTLKAFLTLQGSNFPEIVKFLFNSFDFNKEKKKVFFKIYSDYIKYHESYDQMLLFYKLFLENYRQQFGEDINIEMHQRFIGLFIRAAESFDTAKKWYKFAISKFGNNVKKEIHKSYLFQFVDEEINDFIYEKHSSLIPIIDPQKLDSKKREFINLTLFKFFSNLSNHKVTFNSIKLLLEDILSEGFFPNLRVFNTIIKKFNTSEAIQYLIPIIITSSEIKPNYWTFLITKLEPRQAQNLFLELKKNNQHKSIYIYNCIIDKCNNYIDSLKYIKEMISFNISPDTITYTTIIKQAQSLAEIVNLIMLCSKNNITPDNFMEKSLRRQLQYFKSEFTNYFQLNSKYLYDSLNLQYFVFLEDFRNKISY